MPFLTQHARTAALAACCLGAGAGASAIATAGASTPKPAPAKAARTAGRGAPARLARRAVAGDVVVHTKTGFATATFARGTVKAVSGRQLTVAEGTAKATYRTVTLTIPATARVRDDGAKAGPSSVTAGQRVLVVRAPNRTIVVARTPKKR